MTTEDNPHDETKGTSQVFLVPIPNPDKDKDTNKEGFLNRPRKGGSSIWDWLTLLGVLAVPLVLGIATILLSTQQAHLADLQHESDQKLAQLQHDADQKQALDQQRATILQTYIDNIQDLLLNHNLLGSKSTDDVAVLARARTLTAIQGLDVSRKGVLVKFLYEARLIGLLDSKNKPLPPIINLSGTSLNRTDLDGIDLSNTSLDGVNLYYSTLNGADLNNATLNGADLSGAKLSGANLINAQFKCLEYKCADLSVATLNGANLQEADLTNAILVYAKLSHTFLSGANLINANLYGAHLNNVTLNNADLSGAKLRSADLSNANLYGAYLNSATLNGADLTGANLRSADLRDIFGLTQQQLDEVSTCQGAILPQGLTCHHNQ